MATWRRQEHTDGECSAEGRGSKLTMDGRQAWAVAAQQTIEGRREGAGTSSRRMEGRGRGGSKLVTEGRLA